MKFYYSLENVGKEDYAYLETRGNSYLVISNLSNEEVPFMAEEVFFDNEEDCERSASNMCEYNYLELRSACVRVDMKVGKFKDVENIPMPPMPDVKHYSCGSDDYDGEKSNGELMESFIQRIVDDPDLPNIKHLRLGAYSNPWDDDFFDGTLASMQADGLIKNASKFQHLESLYIGDIDPPYADISGLPNGNYAELLKALPNLKSFTMKGQPGKLTVEGEVLNLPNLEELQIITGGLYKHVVAELQSAQLPNLRKLVICTGIENYGLDVSIKEICGLAQKSRFPSLKYLGIVNSEEQNEIAALLIDSDIIAQLEVLDLSFGTFRDEGGQMLLDNAEKLSHLKVIVDWHFLSDEMIEKLNASPVEVQLSQQQNPDVYGGETYYYSMITE